MSHHDQLNNFKSNSKLNKTVLKNSSSKKLHTNKNMRNCEIVPSTTRSKKNLTVK